ncbi:MAG: TIGR02186 family protein [Alphaproteobacteria bacterium]|nr:TIGR02186 family protein [Alphaproteobacteria bacterium]
MNRWLLLLLCLLFAPPAKASPLVADLSQYRIEMDANFNGTRLFLFGARNDVGDVVAVVRGPARHYMVRKKEPMMGLWVNRERMKLYDVPSFFALASSKPLEELQADVALARLGISRDGLLPPPASSTQQTRHSEFTDAFLTYQQQRRLYTKAPTQLRFMGEMLFKTTIEFPDTIPPGDYTAELYLLRDGEIAGMQSIPITVNKTGLDAFIYNAAHRFPFLYGICAILLALGAGWLAGRWLERN